MGLGGGGSSGGSYPAAYNTTQEYYTQQRADTALQKAQSDAKAATDNAAAEQKFQDSLNSGYNQFITNANSRIAQRGLDPNDFTSQVLNTANTYKLSVPDLAPNPMSAFSTTGVDDILNSEQSRRSNEYLNKFNTLAPTGFEKTLIPDSAISPLIDEVLNPQYTTQQTSLDNALKRGVLDQTGYNSALTKLGTDRTAALGRLQGIGSNLLATDRSDLTGAANSARTGATNYQLGQVYDPNSMYDQILSTTQSDLDNLKGQFAQQTSGLQLFDPATYLNYGGQAQGAGNTASYADLMSAITDNQKKANASRGVGSTGAF